MSESAGHAIPWWRSKAMVGAYVGLSIAVCDGLYAWATEGDLSWRTFVLFLVSSITGWGRKTARYVISGWVLGPDSDLESGDEGRGQGR